jgi:FAD/FMN-containing dehydrogenase
MVVQESAVWEFEQALRGELLRPGDEGYDAARKVWNAMIDKRPALIARCAGPADVISSVRFARDHDLLVTIRGGGHNIAGRSISDGGLVIDLAPMRGVRVDPVRRTARAEGGALLGDLDIETQAFGLATTLGVAPDTGIAGLTLGGGYGWLGGKYGLSCDNLLSVDVVTADGQLLTASLIENDDLFWGIRGAGANFGVVTSFEYQLHPVGSVLGGMVIHPLENGRGFLRSYNQLAAAAPDELSGVAAFLSTPDGKPAVAAVVCYCGPIDEGERLLEPLRTLATPIADQIHPMAYLDMQRLLVPAFPPGHHYYWKSSLIRDLSDDAIEALLACGSKMPTPQSSITLQQLHGAASRVGMSETAFPHRYAHHNFDPTAIWPDPADSERCIRWSRECWDSMQPFVERANYANDLGDEGEERIRAGYGPNYDRLVVLKNKYDPTNFFRMNQNIRPVGGRP